MHAHESLRLADVTSTLLQKLNSPPLASMSLSKQYSFYPIHLPIFPAMVKRLFEILHMSNRVMQVPQVILDSILIIKEAWQIPMFLILICSVL